jgi:hypothetical protein
MNKEAITNKPWFPAVAATVVLMALAIGTYLWIHFTPSVHAGQVLSVNIYPIHRELGTGSPNHARMDGIGGEPEIYDEILVLADVQIKNKTDIPLFLHDMYAVVHLPDGDQRSLAASGRDFDKAFVAYPDLKPLRKDPIQRDITLTPGQQVEGMVIYHYEISKAQWDSRTGMDLTFTFQHQKPLVLSVTNQ